MEINIGNFGPHNRDKRIGNSLYRICRPYDDRGKWYIHEHYTDETTWQARHAYHSDDLQFVINVLNSFTKEKEIIGLPLFAKEDT